MIRKLQILLLVLLLILINGCSMENKSIEHSFFCMGTIFRIELNEDNPKLLIKCENIAKELSSKLNIFDSTSIINQINSNEIIHLEKTTYNIIKESLRWWEISDGYFDPTVAPLTLLWDFKSDNPTPPSKEEIDSILFFIGADKITITDTIIQKPMEVKLDLGGIAKGYAVDILYDTLRNYSDSQFLIDAGCNIKVYGRDYRIGIKNPLNKESILATIILPSSYACATSGSYENYFIHKDKIYHHILNPKTGYPIQDSILSVTIISPSGTDSDCASTSAFAMGSEYGAKLLDRLPDLEYIIIYLDKEGKIAYLKSDNIKGFKEVCR